MRYVFADLIVESDLTLPCLPISAADTADCFVRRRAIDITGSMDEIQDGWLVGRIEDRLVVSIEGAGIFEVDPTQQSIFADIDRCAEDAVIVHLIVDHVLPMYIVARGAMVLHATAAVVDGRAVAIAGKTGTGKSTLVTAMARCGYELLADDCLVVEPDSGVNWQAKASYPATRLRPDSASHLFGAEVFESDATGKSLIGPGVTAIRFRTAPAPLGALVCLRRTSGPRPTPGRQRAGAALASIVGNSLHGITTLGPRLILSRMSPLAATLPVVSLEIPDSLDQLTDSVNYLLHTVRSLENWNVGTMVE